MCSEGVMSGKRRGLCSAQHRGAADRDRPRHENWMEVANRNRKRSHAHSVTIARVICDRDLANIKSAVAAVDLAHPHTYGITERLRPGRRSCYNQAATLN